MNFHKDDRIQKDGNKIYHESARGFVFYEDPKTHKLFVALIKPKGSCGLFISKGHLKNNETPLEAANREICEELSLMNKPVFVSNLAVDEYSFTLDDSGEEHFKKVHLFVFTLDTKDQLSPPVGESISDAVWVEFYEALKDMAYDKDNLLRARQIYYLNKY